MALDPSNSSSLEQLALKGLKTVKYEPSFEKLEVDQYGGEMQVDCTCIVLPVLCYV